LNVILLRVVAGLVGLLGCALVGGGVQLVAWSGSPYYLLCGIALTASAVLLWRRSSAGIAVYGCALAVTWIWAIWEVGANLWALLPRVAALTLLGALLCLAAVRNGLSNTRSLAFSTRLGFVAVTFALAVMLRGLVAPVTPVDPIYQAGTVQPSFPAAIADTPAGEGVSQSGTEWPSYARDAASSHFASLSQITPANVAKLQLRWTFHVGPAAHGLEATPLMIGRTLYTCTELNEIFALDAETGVLRWRFSPRIDVRRVPMPVCRGVAYYRMLTPAVGQKCTERILTNTVDARLIALDAVDGSRCPDFGVHGEISLLEGMGEVVPGYYYLTSAPTVAHDKIVLGGMVADNQYVGEPSGVIRAYDAVTGRLAWAFDVGRPDRSGAPPAGETYTRATPNSWAPMSVDAALGLVYIPTGNATPDFFGAFRRAFDEVYATAVVALDIDTGRPRWTFQTSHHDLWDYDVASPPTLVDLPTVQGVRRALLQPTKRGELFVLDRVTGKPIFPVRERPAPTYGHAPDDRVSATQPFSVGVPSFRGADLTERSMWGLTPLDQLWCRIEFRKARYDGPVTPPGLTSAIEYPSDAGGMEWGGVAVDLDRSIAIVNTNHLAAYTRLLPRAEADALGMKRFTGDYSDHGVRQSYPQEGTPYGVKKDAFLSPLQVPCTPPPFGTLSAVDLVTGKLIWNEPLGSARDIGPWGIPTGLPLTIGLPNLGGALTTRSGLAFIGATQDKYLRAFNTLTGTLLWSARLPAAANATPMTYISPQSDQQFVVVSAGGNGAVAATPGDSIVAFALPPPDASRH